MNITIEYRLARAKAKAEKLYQELRDLTDMLVEDSAFHGGKGTLFQGVLRVQQRIASVILELGYELPARFIKETREEKGGK